MKNSIVSLFIACTITAAGAVPPVGSIAKNVSFAVRDGEGFKKANFNAYQGKSLFSC